MIPLQVLAVYMTSMLAIEWLNGWLVDVGGAWLEIFYIYLSAR